MNVAIAYNTSSINPADLDLYLYKNDYTFGSASSVLASSTSSINVGQSSGSESLTVSNLAAGTYMINVNVFTQARLGASTTYSMTVNSQNACPN